MSYGRMSFFIKLMSNEPSKDTEGFVTNGDTILSGVRAYKKDKHGSEARKNRTAFSTATALFRFRKIPGLTVTTAMFIVCDEKHYNIISAEDVKGRGMYIEVLVEEIEPSERYGISKKYSSVLELITPSNYNGLEMIVYWLLTMLVILRL